MSLTFPTGVRSALADLLVDRLDAGPAAGTLQIRSGSRPASANDAVTGTLLATITLIDPAFGAAASGVATLANPAAVTAAATGTATWFRALDSTGATVFDGRVTATGAGGDLTLATTSLTSGLSVDVTGGTVTYPAGVAD